MRNSTRPKLEQIHVPCSQHGLHLSSGPTPLPPLLPLWMGGMSLCIFIRCLRKPSSTIALRKSCAPLHLLKTWATYYKCACGQADTRRITTFGLGSTRQLAEIISGKGSPNAEVILSKHAAAACFRHAFMAEAARAASCATAFLRLAAKDLEVDRRRAHALALVGCTPSCAYSAKPYAICDTGMSAIPTHRALSRILSARSLDAFRRTRQKDDSPADRRRRPRFVASRPSTR